MIVPKPVSDTTSETGANFLPEVVAEINKSVPMEMEPRVILLKADNKGKDLVYNYRLTALNPYIKTDKDTAYRKLKDWWCSREDAAEFRQLGVKVIYNYFDEQDRLLDVITVDTAAC